MGILAFILEPVPPARIRKPTFANPVNSQASSLLLSEAAWQSEVGRICVDVGWNALVAGSITNEPKKVEDINSVASDISRERRELG